ncbi:hypothetical protein M514_09199 [Trichuris suis]|uniref:Uncharacterized protein n=1 Tax=Trichuris suis TaxID=68888 RepID=A0A085LYD9_9BILA|nr:hypothetical protein M513_09199 [Trichuris suis]KFD62741.1 hypothetical protein M514_09199 [Trichuris suis]
MCLSSVAEAQSLPVVLPRAGGLPRIPYPNMQQTRLHLLLQRSKTKLASKCTYLAFRVIHRWEQPGRPSSIS